MKKLLLSLFLLLAPSTAFAQCNGIFPNGTFCGNLSGASAPGGPIALNISGIVGPGSTTVGDIVTWNNTLGTLVADSGILASTVVVGPASATANDVPIFSGTSGKLVADSGISFGSQAQSLFLATPSGGSGVPLFRAITAADLPAGFNCSTSGAFPVGTGSTTQCSTTAGSIATLNGGALSINPTSSTLNQGLLINQTLPGSGSQSPAYNANAILVTVPGYAVTGSALDAFGVLPYLSAFRVNMATASPGIVVGGSFNWAANGGGQQPVALFASAYSNLASSASDILWGIEGFVNVGPSGVISQAIPIEAIVASPTSTNITVARVGFSAVSQGPTTTATYDTAVIVAAQLGPLAAGYAAGGPWKNGITFATGLRAGGVSPISSTGSMITADTFTTGSFANFPNVTFQNFYLNFQNMAVNGSGRAVFGAGSASIPAGSVQVVATCASCGQSGLSVFTNTNTANSFDGQIITDSQNLNRLLVGIWEANVTGGTITRFGQAAGNWAVVTSDLANSNGLMVGTVSNKSLVFGTNNTLAGLFDNSQRLIVTGVNTTPVGSNAMLTVNRNATGTMPSGGFTATDILAQFVQVDNSNNRLVMVAAGSSAALNAISALASRGTVAAPAASQNSDLLAAFSAAPFGANQYLPNGGARIVVQVVETGNGGVCTNTACGTGLSIFSTPIGSAGAVAVANFVSGAQIGAPTGGDEGAGTLNVATAYYLNGTKIAQTATSPLSISNGVISLGAPYGATSYTAGAILVGNGASNIATVADVTTGALLASGGAGSNPSYCTACQVSGSVAIGNTGNTIAANVLLQLSAQAGVASPTPLVTGTVLQIVGTNANGSTLNSVEMDAFANGQGAGAWGNLVNGVGYGGTLASKTATPNGALIWSLNACGYDGTSTQCGGNAGAQLNMQTTAQWSGSTRETAISLNATPAGSTTRNIYLSVGGTFTVALYNLAAGAGSGALCGVNNMTNSTGGSITYDNGANCIVSMREAKQDIQPIGDALAEIMQFVPVQFRYRPGYGDDGKRLQVGLIAQDVETVDPRCAAYDSNDKLEGVRYIQCVAVAFRAIQQLKADNDNLRAELVQLKKAVNR